MTEANRRPFPVPVDPATWAAVDACLAHHDQLATLNPHVIVTRVTRTDDKPADGSYLTRQLAAAGHHAVSLPADKETGEDQSLASEERGQRAASRGERAVGAGGAGQDRAWPGVRVGRQRTACLARTGPLPRRQRGPRPPRAPRQTWALRASHSTPSREPVRVG
jgi:hypothetical protein